MEQRLRRGSVARKNRWHRLCEPRFAEDCAGTPSDPRRGGVRALLRCARHLPEAFEHRGSIRCRCIIVVPLNHQGGMQANQFHHLAWIRAVVHQVASTHSSSCDSARTASSASSWRECRKRLESSRCASRSGQAKACSAYSGVYFSGRMFGRRIRKCDLLWLLAVVSLAALSACSSDNNSTSRIPHLRSRARTQLIVRWQAVSDVAGELRNSSSSTPFR